ncbi:hypothetical protein OF83DRAFT_1169370 [Amylostereum chailletii]|nr:hypothetical protein OF83DRAFT_1169370 [Amylostereum chailletii]
MITPRTPSSQYSLLSPSVISPFPTNHPATSSNLARHLSSPSLNSLPSLTALSRSLTRNRLGTLCPWYTQHISALNAAYVPPPPYPSSVRQNAATGRAACRTSAAIRDASESVPVPASASNASKNAASPSASPSNLGTAVRAPLPAVAVSARARAFVRGVGVNFDFDGEEAGGGWGGALAQREAEERALRSVASAVAVWCRWLVHLVMTTMKWLVDWLDAR